MVFTRFCAHPSIEGLPFKWQECEHGRMRRVSGYAVVSNDGETFVTALSSSQALAASPGETLEEMKPVDGEFDPWSESNSPRMGYPQPEDDGWGCR